MPKGKLSRVRDQSKLKSRVNNIHLHFRTTLDIVHLGSPTHPEAAASAEDTMGLNQSSPSSSPASNGRKPSRPQSVGSGNNNTMSHNGYSSGYGSSTVSSSSSAAAGPAARAAAAHRPAMPDEAELERRFNEVLVQMDLPPERAKHLRGFDAAMKWDIICDQEQVSECESYSYSVHDNEWPLNSSV